MILRQLFQSYLDGCKACGFSDGESDAPLVQRMLERLPKTRLGSDGRVLEWQTEYEEPEPGHRHISHMYGLHPGNEITVDQPELFEGAKKDDRKAAVERRRPYWLEPGMDRLLFRPAAGRRSGI